MGPDCPFQPAWCHAEIADVARGGAELVLNILAGGDLTNLPWDDFLLGTAFWLSTACCLGTVLLKRLFNTSGSLILTKEGTCGLELLLSPVS